MSWTAPTTWVANTLVLDTMLNPQIRDNLNLLATAIDTATGKIQGITSAYIKSLAGLITLQDENITPGNNSGAGETTLITYTLPANTISVVGMGIRITSWGSTTNSANQKIVKQYFGASSIYGFAGMLANSVAHLWAIRTLVFRRGSAAECFNSSFHSGATNASNSNVSSAGGTLSVDLTTNQTIKVTGQGGASNEITAAGQMIEVFQQ